MGPFFAVTEGLAIILHVSLHSYIEKLQSNFAYSNNFLPAAYGFYYDIQVLKVTHIFFEFSKVRLYGVPFLRLPKG